ncbi:CbiK1 [Desulforapulum autotrophicum HRM2]|uniref:CbiK1 n=1 Tax=Desulforapulum autotrophicum (strain ATCC 43914 / DSM 3382 / VKM B-1955 / HRM2) TaxID=177437 RepID=C0QJM9_DESAH|nr:sirohydrochlorin cobaltochelatase [Desulforapulum autotrophicum]ACN13882.1 CbiK1 [Desulforapulum autotrophicum HRM2]
MIKKIGCFIFSLVVLLALTSVASASESQKKAIVLASFGTSYPDALKSLINIGELVRNENPGVVVKHAFTSNIIRKIWQERQTDTAFQSENKGVPEEFLYIKNPLATIADLQNEGYRTIVVQPTHVYAGEEFADLKSYVAGFNSIKTLKAKFMPFDKLVLGRPALGEPGKSPDYHEDIEIAAKALAEDVAYAKSRGAALVYMGHGNEYFSTGVYAELQDQMRRMYPDVNIFIGTVEGFPSLDTVTQGLKHTNVKKIVLKPLMVVAGDHANNDMASDEEDSWKTIFTKMGITVECIVKGLGENDQWVKIYGQHIKDIINE